MKEIDILNGIANGEIKQGFKIKSKTGNIYEYIEGERHFVNVKNKMYVWTLGDFTRLNDEIEIIEEDKEIEEINIEWFKQVDMFDPKSVELAIEMIAKQTNELVKAVNELKKGK